MCDACYRIPEIKIDFNKLSGLRAASPTLEGRQIDYREAKNKLDIARRELVAKAKEEMVDTERTLRLKVRVVSVREKDATALVESVGLDDVAVLRVPITDLHNY